MNINDTGSDSVKIGFIGAGRLGRALAWSFAARGLTVHRVASQLEQDARSIVEKAHGCLIVTPQRVADECDVIFVTTPDDTIKPIADSIEWRPGTGVVHCSGATEVSALSKAASDSALIGGFHPMQTFGDPEAAARTLRGCVITIEASGELLAFLSNVSERLGCRVNQLPPGARGRYHAAAAYASQYVNVILAEAVRIWASWGASEAAALQALLPVVRGTVSSIETAGLAKGMPGPVSRGDAGTVEKHLAALATVDNPTIDLYRELCLRSVPLAEIAGGIDAETSDRIRKVLARSSFKQRPPFFDGVHY